MKRGFTLIELLAVIVILAIIALIAVPIVIYIINDTKTSSGEEAVKLYIDSVKKAISRKQLEINNFNPTECTIKDNGNLLCNSIDVIVDMKGSKPNKGIIEIKDNQVTYKNLLLNGTYYNRLATSVQDNNKNGKPDIGDKYTYKVNEKDTFNFYVLSFNEEDDTVNLIMDRNICNDGTVNYTKDNNYCRTSWHKGVDDNNYGPDTAMYTLYQETKSWTNVPDMIMDYDDEENKEDDSKGYYSIKTDLKSKVTTIIGKQNKISVNQIFGDNNAPLKARLPKLFEVKNSNCTTTALSCPKWLYDNLNHANDIYTTCYWLLSSHQDLTGHTHNVSYEGRLELWGMPTLFTKVSRNDCGLRPVITVPKSYLE